MTYYDLDAILTDSQKVPCTFQIEVPGLGYLDNNPSRPLKKGTQVELPLWLCEMLAVSSSSQKSLVRLDLPSCLSPRVLNALKADAKTLDLRALAPHFYALGARMMELFEEEEVCDVLMQSFKARAQQISDHAVNASRGAGTGGGGVGGNEAQDFLRGLDEMERLLFRAAFDGSRATKTWMGDMKKG